MISASIFKADFLEFSKALCRIFRLGVFLLACITAIHAQALSGDSNTLIIDEANDTEVFAFGKNVVVKKEAKGVLVFGGDLIVEGRIEGEAAAIGGSVYQKKDAFIGGDVIVIGGKYQSERTEPLRNSGKETIMYAGYEEELRNLTQHPAQIFSPTLSWKYLAQRLLSTLFWFIISLIITTIAPGAISRAAARFQLSALKIAGIGLLTFITITLGVITGLSVLPAYLSGIIGLMASLMLICAYVYGRVTLQVIFGKWFQKQVLAESRGSESIALLAGAVIWTVMTSIPYFGSAAVVLLFAVSLGLILTARTKNGWGGK